MVIGSGYHYSAASFLLLISFFINESSRPVCPLTDEFSCALLIKYGITSFIGPNGKYLLALNPALERLKVMLSLMPYNWRKEDGHYHAIFPFYPLIVLQISC